MVVGDVFQHRILVNSLSNLVGMLIFYIDLLKRSRDGICNIAFLVGILV